MVFLLDVSAEFQAHIVDRLVCPDCHEIVLRHTLSSYDCREEKHDEAEGTQESRLHELQGREGDAVPEGCTGGTRLLYCRYRAFVLAVQGLCTGGTSLLYCRQDAHERTVRLCLALFRRAWRLGLPYRSIAVELQCHLLHIALSCKHAGEPPRRGDRETAALPVAYKTVAPPKGQVNLTRRQPSLSFGLDVRIAPSAYALLHLPVDFLA